MALRVRILAWFHLVTGGIGLALLILLCFGVAADATYRQTLAWVFPVSFAFAFFWFLPAVLGGWGLLIAAPWGRWLVWTLSAVMLPLIPVGTIIGGASVWVLFSTRARTSENFERSMASVEAAGKRHFGFALAALAAVVILAGMIGLGYLFRHQIERLPSPNTRLIGPIVFGVCILVFVGYRVVTGRGFSVQKLTPEAMRLRREGRVRAEAKVAAHEQRLALLAADPIRAPYVALMRRGGEYWSDEQIAYDLAPDRPATCVHLAPIEQAMRRAGVKVRWLADKHVIAACRVDEAALRADLKPAPEVHYAADLFPGGGRGSEEFPNCALQCAACNSGIHTLHERESTVATPWFPREPV